MKKLSLIFAILIVFFPAAEFGQTVLLPELSSRASVSQTIGITEISVSYHRPSVQKREIWGQLVPYGFNDLGFGTSKAAPWRAGANENTLITFQHDVTVANSPLKAGTYGLFMAPSADGAVLLIFSKDTQSWGSFFYDPTRDALRVTVHLEDSPFHELLTYGFTDVTKDSALLALYWDKKRVPIPLKVNTNEIVVASLKEELRGAKGFQYQAWVAASNYLLTNNLDLPLALTWAEFAISDPAVGERNFATLSNKADILEKMGRGGEAASVMDTAMKFGTPMEIHQYGRQQQALHHMDRAIAVFKLNAELHPGVWPVDYGLARAYSATGDFKTALHALVNAQALVPPGDSVNTAAIKVNIERLKRGETIN